MKNKKPLYFLDFDDNVNKVFEIIKKNGSIRPTDIAKKTGVKRTSVNYILLKLKGRGIVEKIKLAGHYEWKKSNNRKIENQIDSLYEFLGVSFSDKTISVPGDMGVMVAKGKSNVLNEYLKLLEEDKNRRIFAIQGNKSVMASESFGNFNLSIIQRKIKKNKIIIEGILGESTLDYLKTIDKNLLNEYRNRLVVPYIIDDNFIDFDMDIFISKDRVMMINFEKSLAVVIKNENIYTAILNMFKVMRLTSKKIDLNAYIEKLMMF